MAEQDEGRDVDGGTPPGNAPKAWLIVLDGPAAGERLLLEERLTIGRSSHCELTLPVQSVSRTHAEIVVRNDEVVLRDLGSVNGTYLNNRLITTARLHHGDMVTVGESTLRVEMVAPTGDPSTDSHVVLRAPDSTAPNRVRMRGRPGALQESLLSVDATRAQRARLRLDALVTVTQRLTRLQELPVLYPLIVGEVMRVLPAERVVLFRVGRDGDLEAQVARHAGEPGAQVDVSRTILDEVRKQRVCVLSADALEDAKIAVSNSILTQEIRSVLCVPIEFDTELLGALYLDAPGRQGMFTEEDLHFVSGIAGIAAVAITNAVAMDTAQAASQELNHAYLSMLAVLANAIEARDHYTIGHTWRVARFAQVIARRLGWGEDKLNEIEVGGMLHDIGKIGVPDSILTKCGPLSSQEQELMELHPQIGATMLRDVTALQPVLPYVLHHHERFNGSGYPHGLAGGAIPEEARLLAVADALDAMISNRPYRRGLDRNAAFAELRQSAGTQFDPAVVEALITAYEAGELDPYLRIGLHDARDIICPHCSTYSTPQPETVEARRMTCPTCKRQLTLHLDGDRIHAELA